MQVSAKLVTSGINQTVSLPKECQFKGNDVFIRKTGDVVLLYPKEKEWEIFLDGINSFSKDFMQDGRDQGLDQVRENIDVKLCLNKYKQHENLEWQFLQSL
jgi:antitoxin VapB